MSQSVTSSWGGYPDGKCSCVKTHSPSPQRINAHHVVPQSWGGQTVSDNLVDICPSTHVNTHKLIDEYVRAKGTPARSIVLSYNRFTQKLARWAWEHRPGDSPPYTSLGHAD